MPWPCDFFGAQKDALAAEPKADAGALPSCGPSGACDAVPQLLRCEPRGAGCRGSGIRRPLRAVDNTVHPDRTCAPAGRSTDRATCTPAAAGELDICPGGAVRGPATRDRSLCRHPFKGALLPPGGLVGLGNDRAPCPAAPRETAEIEPLARRHHRLADRRWRLGRRLRRPTKRRGGRLTPWRSEWL